MCLVRVVPFCTIRHELQKSKQNILRHFTFRYTVKYQMHIATDLCQRNCQCVEGHPTRMLLAYAGMWDAFDVRVIWTVPTPLSSSCCSAQAWGSFASCPHNPNAPPVSNDLNNNATLTALIESLPSRTGLACDTHCQYQRFASPWNHLIRIQGVSNCQKDTRR